RIDHMDKVFLQERLFESPYVMFEVCIASRACKLQQSQLDQLLLLYGHEAFVENTGKARLSDMAEVVQVKEAVRFSTAIAL
ncbi:hypothetical protein, partial [Pseudomonas antarctica]|uniref:hypothetical protein n=1 Tax=Pseudomonas antarctica TaxID=219572 RepID=UPI00387AE393